MWWMQKVSRSSVLAITTSRALHIDDMYASLTAHDFYEAMRGGDEPSTSQVTLGEFLEVFKQAYEEGKPAVLLSFSSALSGSYSTACIAADQIKQEHPDFELHVVDTKLASIAEGLLSTRRSGSTKKV